MEEKQKAVPVYAGVYEEIAEIIGKERIEEFYEHFKGQQFVFPDEALLQRICNAGDWPASRKNEDIRYRKEVWLQRAVCSENAGEDKSGGYVCGRGKGVDREQN